MSHQLKLKQTIISVIPLYISRECQAFNELKQAIENIPDDKFVQTINKKSLTITERIDHLFDEVFFLVNEHCPIIHEQGFQLDSFTNEIKKIFFDLLNENQTNKKSCIRISVRGWSVSEMV